MELRKEKIAMARVRITDETLLKWAKDICHILRDKGEWIHLSDLAEAVGITPSQIKAAVKYQRRWFLDNPEKCGNVYILSSSKGYKLPVTDDDYLSVYKSLYAWGKSVLVTISPIGRYLDGKGYDMRAIREQAMEAHGLNIHSLGGSDSWQDEE